MMEYPKDYRMSRLIAKKLMGVIRSEEEKKLDTWLEEDIKNRNLYEHILDEENILSRDLYAKRLDVEYSWKLLRGRLIRQGECRHLFFRYIAVAVSVILLIGIGLYWSTRKNQEVQPVETIARIEMGSSKAVLVTSCGDEIVLQDSSVQLIALGKGMVAKNDSGRVSYEGINSVENEEALEYNIIRVPRGGEYKLFLSDNTEVFLNSDSEIRFPVKFGKNRRDVFLSGEAFFIISKDVSRPFIVNANNKVSVEVLGTQFNLQAYSDEDFVKTTLSEGRVRVYDEKQSVKLHPDEQAIYNGTDGKFTTRKVDASKYSAWKDGRFVLQNCTLGDIMTRLGRWYNVDILWVDSEVKKYHFSGELARYKDFVEILRMLELATQVRFEVKDRTILVHKVVE